MARFRVLELAGAPAPSAGLDNLREFASSLADAAPYADGIFGGGSRAQPTQTVTQTAAPPSYALPTLTAGAHDALQLYKQDAGFKPWTGAVNADLNANTTAGLDKIRSIANSGSRLTDAAGNAVTSLMDMSGQGANDPFLKAALDTNAKRIQDSVASSMSGSGRYGSFAHGAQLADRIQENNAPVLFQANEAARGRQMQAAGMAPALDDARYAPAERLLGVGSFYDQRAQNDLNQQRSVWDANQSRAWDNLARMNAIATGAGQLGQTRSTTTPVQQPSLLQSLMGGAMAGGAIGGPWGAAAGGLLGAFAR